MKLKTIFGIFLLLLTLSITNCGSNRPDKVPESVEEAEKLLAKKHKKQARISKKENKIANKRYWKSQSKKARKSIKKNRKRQKRIARHNKKKLK